jgi:hypothetical protein
MSLIQSAKLNGHDPQKRSQKPASTTVGVMQLTVMPEVRRSVRSFETSSRCRDLSTHIVPPCTVHLHDSGRRRAAKPARRLFC